MSNYKNIESALIRGGIFGDPLTRSVNVPRLTHELTGHQIYYKSITKRIFHL